MLLLFPVILILWVSTIEGQVGICDFPNIKHGMLYDENKYKPEFPLAFVGKVFYYSCEYSFVSPSRSFWTQITCTEKGWLPIPTCLRLCFFPSVENGHSTSSGQTHLEGDTVTIFCNVGYSLPNNKKTISCTEGGWSSAPKCTPIQSCDMPVFVNARNKGRYTSFKLNEKLDYECSDGYENRNGNITGSIVCGENGWSDLPICYEIECSIPLFEENVNVSPKKEHYKVGDVLQFTCRRGFTRVGPDSVQCYQFGWSPNIPTCKEQVKPCGPTPHLPHGEVKDIQKGEYQHNEVVEYHCYSTFQMIGPKRIQCVDGEWTSLPICVEQVKTCGYLPTLEYGYVQTSVHVYQHGYSVETKCQNTHTMIGNNTITCINGMWTELPKCIAKGHVKKCKRPHDPRVVLGLTNQAEFDHNTRLPFRCIPHFQQYKQTTCINGKWDPEPDCTRRMGVCPPPPQIPNAQNRITTVNYQHGEKIPVLCKENYQLQDSKELVCKHGQWQSLPRCIASTGQCGPPPRLANGDLTSFPLSVYPSGSIVSYLCQSLYELRGSPDVTCRNGQWSEMPRCIDACVISLEDMNKNNIQLKWSKSKKLYSKAGDIVEFECIPSYEMKTPKQSFRVICQEGKIEYPRCDQIK